MAFPASRFGERAGSCTREESLVLLPNTTVVFCPSSDRRRDGSGSRRCDRNLPDGSASRCTFFACPGGRTPARAPGGRIWMVVPCIGLLIVVIVMSGRSLADSSFQLRQIPEHPSPEKPSIV